MPQDTIFTLDVRGLKCPEPVIQTKKLFDQGNLNRFIVIVDNDVSRENVSRFARNLGAIVEVSPGGGPDWKIYIHIEEPGTKLGSEEPLIPCPIIVDQTVDPRKVVYVGSNVMGRGNDDLGAKLMRGFVRTMIDVKPYPWRMLFINSGVKLTTIDQEAVEAISLLEREGLKSFHVGLASTLLL